MKIQKPMRKSNYTKILAFCIVLIDHKGCSVANLFGFFTNKMSVVLFKDASCSIVRRVYQSQTSLQTFLLHGFSLLQLLHV